MNYPAMVIINMYDDQPPGEELRASLGLGPWVSESPSGERENYSSSRLLSIVDQDCLNELFGEESSFA